MSNKELADYNDCALDAAIKAWGAACEASRHPDHIEVADRIRNQLVGEQIRRARGAN